MFYIFLEQNNLRLFVCRSCLAVTCDKLPAPLNGDVGFTDVERRVGSVATYTCAAGFELRRTDDMTRECGPDGTWDGSEPTCCEVAFQSVCMLHHRSFSNWS